MSYMIAPIAMSHVERKTIGEMDIVNIREKWQTDNKYNDYDHAQSSTREVYRIRMSSLRPFKQTFDRTESVTTKRKSGHDIQSHHIL